MSTERKERKKGRKCSIKFCNNFQHTHKHLSFFRFPKDVERCHTWIEKTKRFDLLGKANVHDERICQQHFEPTMFLNESQNRLQQYAIPTLYLTAPASKLMITEVRSQAGNIFNNSSPNMGIVNAAAALLSQNNLTITPVYSSKPKPIANESAAEPLNLSVYSQKSTSSSSDSSVVNISTSSEECPTNSIQVSPEKPPTTGPTSNGIVPTATHVYANYNTNASTSATNGGFRRARQVFTVDQENQLADYIRETSIFYSGLSSKEARILAFVYGVCNRVEMPPGWHESHQASFDWCVGFMKRTKLPPALITGISTKGSNKQSKPPVHIEPKYIAPQPNPISAQMNGAKNNGNIINETPIEID